MTAKKLSAFLESVLVDALGLPSAAVQVRLLKSWEEVVGPLLAAKTCPGKVRNGVLTVFVRNHPWAQELHLSKPALLERIRSVEGGEMIREIRFAVDSAVFPPAAPAAGEDPPSGGEDPPAPADPDGLDGVRDPETRDLLRSISRKSSRRKR